MSNSRDDKKDEKNTSKLGDFLSLRDSPFHLLYLYLNSTDKRALGRTSKQIQYNVELETVFNFIQCVVDPEILSMQETFDGSERSFELMTIRFAPELIKLLRFEEKRELYGDHKGEIETEHLMEFAPIITFLNIQMFKERFIPPIQAVMEKLSDAWNKRVKEKFTKLAGHIDCRKMVLFSHHEDGRDAHPKESVSWSVETEEICHEVENLLSSSFSPDSFSFDLLFFVFLLNYGGTPADDLLFQQLIKWGLMINKCLDRPVQSLPLVMAGLNLFGLADKLIQMLLNAGADINLADNEGKTALWHARDLYDKELEIILQRHGAVDETLCKPYTPFKFFKKEKSKKSKQAQSLNDFMSAGKIFELQEIKRCYPNAEADAKRDNTPRYDLQQDMQESVGARSGLLFSCSVM